MTNFASDRGNPAVKIPRLNALTKEILGDIYEEEKRRRPSLGAIPELRDIAFDDRRADGVRILLYEATWQLAAGNGYRDVAGGLERRARELFRGAATKPKINLDDARIYAGRTNPEKLVSGVLTLLGFPRSVMNFLDNEYRRTQLGAGVHGAHTDDPVGSPPKA